MLDEIRAFNREIDAIVGDIGELEQKTLRNPDIEDRIRQLFVTWSHILKPRVEAAGVTIGKIMQLDSLLELTARNSGKQIDKRFFKNKLRDGKKILNIVTVELARLLPFDGQQPEPKTRTNVIEEIPDLADDSIPNSILGWKSNIKNFLNVHPYDQNVFIMIRYAKESSSLLQEITKAVSRVEIDGRKFFPVVAKDHRITDDLYNPIACLLCCRYGIAVFDSTSKSSGFNPNVAYELGTLHFLKRKCLILKHSKIKTMPSDILQKLYDPFSNPKEAAEQVDQWLRKLAVN